MDNHSSLASGWENVQEFSFPLAVFGAVLCTLQPVVCIGGSILLLLVIIKFPQLRHIPSNLLLASLAASDLLIGVLVQTGRAAMSVYVLTTSESGSLPNILQTGYFASFLLHSSVLTIAAITVDRYISITRSLRYHLIVTESRVIKVLAVNWLISAILPAARLIPPFPMIGIRVLQSIIISVLFTIAFCYAKILRISRRHKKHVISQLQAVSQGPREQEFQSAKTVFIVVGVVISCYLPLLVVQFLLIVNSSSDRVKVVHTFALTMFLLNSSINPVIIFYRSRKLRSFLKRLFKRNAYIY